MGALLQRILKGELGYKTVVAALLILVSVVGPAFGWLTPEQAEKFLRGGEALGFVGIRDAISKLPK